MNRISTVRASALLLFALGAADVHAQRAPKRFETAADTVIPVSRTPVIRVGKWVTLGSAAGFAAWAVSINQSADERYRDLEQACVSTPSRCRRAQPGGAFQDAALEAEYQDILKLDQRAGRVLGIAEASILASIVMFILDLPGRGSGEGIPYSPPRFRWGLTRTTFQFVAFLPI